MLLKKPLLALFALSLFSGVTAHAESLSDWDVIVVGESNTGEYYDAVHSIKKLNTVTGSTEILSTKTFLRVIMILVVQLLLDQLNSEVETHYEVL